MDVMNDLEGLSEAFSQLKIGFIRQASEVAKIKKDHRELIDKLTVDYKTMDTRLQLVEAKIQQITNFVNNQELDIRSESLLTRDWIYYCMEILIASHAVPPMIIPLSVNNFHFRIPPPAPRNIPLLKELAQRFENAKNDNNK